MPTKRDLIEQFDAMAPRVDKWRRRGRHYHEDLASFLRFHVPEGRAVLEIGCSTGWLLNSLKPSRGVGIDVSERTLQIAREAYPQYQFVKGDAEALPIDEKFDYVILSNLVGHLTDVYQAFTELRRVCTPSTRVIVTHYSKLWEPVLNAAEKLRLKMPEQLENWLTLGDLENLLYLAGFETIKRGKRMLLPKYVPLLSSILNRYAASFQPFTSLCLTEYVVARLAVQSAEPDRGYTASVIIPTKDEAGNVEGAVTRTPDMGPHTELIFIDGHSTDGTVEEIERMVREHPARDIKFASQDGKGKGDAVRKGFDMATGDILFILDSDLTVPPEDLPKFYDSIASGRGEFINGCRLVYPMEKEAMRTLNLIANRCFGWLFTWLLDQPIKDTLCGTKVLFRRDYERLKLGRDYFGDFDPFGDFDLLFGAAKLGLKIVDLPIRYRERVYGDIKISRFRHGWLLLKMCMFAWRKLKVPSAR